MRRTIDVVVSLKSWILLGGMLGFCGAVAFGIGSAVYAVAFKHDFAEAGEALIGSLVGFTFAGAAFALIGYPVYRYALCKSPHYRTLSVSETQDVA